MTYDPYDSFSATLKKDLIGSRNIKKKTELILTIPLPPSPQLLERNHRKRRLYWAVDLYIQIETFTFCAILVKTDQISLIFCLFMLSFRNIYGFTMKMIKYLFFFSFEPSKRVSEHFILIGLFNFGLHFGRFFSFNSVFFPLTQ